MSITINTQPNALNAVGECFKVGATVSAPASADVIRKLQYTLLDDQDNIILPAQSVQVTGREIPLDFAPHLKGQVYTTVPTVGQTIRFIDLNFSKSFKVRFEEVDFDISQQGSTVVNEVATTSIGKVLNVAPRYWQNGLLTTTSPIVFSHKPNVIRLSPNQNDWLWLYTGSGATFTVTLSVDDNIQYIDTSLIQDRVYTFGIGAPNLTGASISGTPKKAVIQFMRNSSLFASYTILFDQQCDDEEWREVYFQEPLGSISSVLFDEFQFSIPRTSSAVQLEMQCNTLLGLNATKTGGLSGTNAKAFRQISWTKEIANANEWVDFYEGMQASNHFWVLQKFGNLQAMTKIIMDNVTITPLDRQGTAILNMSGRVFKDVGNLTNSL